MRSVAATGGALRVVLTAIVLVNLAFVHATDDASFAWLAPMYVAALASPWLARLTDSAVYRWLWNLAVVGIFLVLVRHTADAGPRYLLEDGLRLAAVCQVHVLCTLGTRQKPDLLFFNSFLIAVVTAFLTQDLPYSVVFLAYAPLLVVGLALYSAEPADAPRAVVRDALPRAAFALAATFVVFFACPRDFHRKGLVVEKLTLGPAAQALDVGFADEVKLDRQGGVSSSDAVVLRARVRSGHAGDVPAYWRGATQTAFDGERWIPGGSACMDDAAWRASGARTIVRGLSGAGPTLDVELVDASAGRLFAPASARRMSVVSEHPDDGPEPLADATVRFLERRGQAAWTVTYRLELGADAFATDGVTPSPAPPELAPALALDARAASPAVKEFADRVRSTLPADAPQRLVVERFRERLASRTDYLEPGSEGAATSVESFVRGDGGGHCEHFATALALTLRHVGVPCRLVTGYVGDDWDDRTATLTIRRRDAHAWVEVKDPAAGWYTVDPTPSAARAAARANSLLAAVATWFSDAWDRIVKFDDEARTAAVAWFAALPGRAVHLVSSAPIASAAAAAIAALFVALRIRRRTRAIPADVRAYRSCLRRLRLTPRPGETPRDVLARAAIEGLPRDAVARLEAATQRHEAARYAATA